MKVHPNWVNIAGVNPVAYVRKYSGRVPVLRLKGFTGSKTENMYKLIGIEDKKASYTKAFEFRSVGYGKQDVPSLLEAANECETKWLVAEQDAPHGQKTSLECAEMYSI